MKQLQEFLLFIIAVLTIGLIGIVLVVYSEQSTYRVILTHDQALAFCESQDMVYDYESGECLIDLESIGE